ncbi:PaaI family thioesterase [Streptomyces sp. NPDC018026]|uniref:PaaI family thioesterase n=1 Tax=Streptomyces sp. NPDC018026 TaxID=3365031 RepID=UPI003790D29D
MTVDEYGSMTSALRVFLDAVSVAGRGADFSALAADLHCWADRLAAHRVDEPHRAFGGRFDLPGRGQTMTPLFDPSTVTPVRVEGTAYFGDYFLGSNNAAHGGAVPLLFDEVLGRIVVERGPRARTAYLRTDFRAITPIGRDLTVRGWVDEVCGRKLFLRAELRDGEVLCAEADALFVVLRQDAP